MTNAQILKSRIKSQCEKQEKSMSAMLSELSLGVNAINQINEKKGMGSFVLSKIADYLNCSVDYLLGRTDEPHTISGHSINTGDIQGNNNANINEKEEKNCSEIDGTDLELLTAFSALNLGDKAKVMSLIAELNQK